MNNDSLIYAKKDFLKNALELSEKINNAEYWFSPVIKEDLEDSRYKIAHNIDTSKTIEELFNNGNSFNIDTDKTAYQKIANTLYYYKKIAQIMIIKSMGIDNVQFTQNTNNIFYIPQDLKHYQNIFTNDFTRKEFNHLLFIFSQNFKLISIHNQQFLLALDCKNLKDDDNFESTLPIDIFSFTPNDYAHYIIKIYMKYMENIITISQDIEEEHAKKLQEVENNSIKIMTFEEFAEQYEEK